MGATIAENQPLYSAAGQPASQPASLNIKRFVLISGKSRRGTAWDAFEREKWKIANELQTNCKKHFPFPETYTEIDPLSSFMAISITRTDPEWHALANAAVQNPWTLPRHVPRTFWTTPSAHSLHTIYSNVLGSCCAYIKNMCVRARARDSCMITCNLTVSGWKFGDRHWVMVKSHWKKNAGRKIWF